MALYDIHSSAFSQINTKVGEEWLDSGKLCGCVSSLEILKSGWNLFLVNSTLATKAELRYVHFCSDSQLKTVIS